MKTISVHEDVWRSFRLLVEEAQVSPSDALHALLSTSSLSAALMRDAADARAVVLRQTREKMKMERRRAAATLAPAAPTGRIKRGRPTENANESVLPG